jgi:arylsulfatase A-like enzyme
VVANYEAPPDWVPATLTADQIREVNAMVHIENELIDEACGRVLQRVSERGWLDDTDVFFTTDHGELQGDFGLLFKGPYHVDALMRLPMIWRPAPSAGVAPAVVPEPVGHVDLAPTFCAVAGVPVAPWMEGSSFPTTAGGPGRERVLTEWDSAHAAGEVHLQTITRNGWVGTTYRPGSWHDGTEGELYDLADDPLQHHNLWDDPSRRAVRDDLIADLHDHMPAPLDPSERRAAVAPV